MILEYISVGPLIFPTYPILIVLGLWVGTGLSSKEAVRLGIRPDHVYNMIASSLIATLIGGRIWYVLSHWEAYADNLGYAFLPILDAIALPEALCLSLGVIIIYSRLQNLALAQVADILACGLAIGLALVSLGAFLGSHHLGAISQVPWAIRQLGEARHPVYLYHLILLLLSFGLTWYRREKGPWLGFNALRFTTLYAGSWLIIDPFFAWSPTSEGGFRLVQIGALLVILVSLVSMAFIDLTKHSATHDPKTETNPS